MLSTNNIAMQFGAKPLFENISVKFGTGNSYGIIDANECIAKLHQDQLAFEWFSVLDTTLKGDNK